MIKVTKGKVNEHQGEFGKEKRCVEQIFPFEMMVEKIVKNCMPVACMDLEKAYDKVDRIGMLIGTF